MIDFFAMDVQGYVKSYLSKLESDSYESLKGDINWHVGEMRVNGQAGTEFVAICTQIYWSSSKVGYQWLALLDGYRSDDGMQLVSIPPFYVTADHVNQYGFYDALIQPRIYDDTCACCGEYLPRFCRTWGSYNFWVSNTLQYLNCKSCEKSIQQAQRTPYKQYLQSEHWQGVRRGALERAEHRCQLCNSGNHLHVHHRTYERIGKERDADVIVLCRECHAKFHDKVVN